MRAVTLVFGQGGPGGTQDLAARLMAQPFGRYLVAAAGLVTLTVAVYLFHKAWTAAYRKQIGAAPEMRGLEPLLWFGLAAHGIVLLINGGLLRYAAVVTDPSEAAGLGEALRILESQSFGQILLALAGVGMIGFAVYCFKRALRHPAATGAQRCSHDRIGKRLIGRFRRGGSRHGASCRRTASPFHPWQSLRPTTRRTRRARTYRSAALRPV